MWAAHPEATADLTAGIISPAPPLTEAEQACERGGVAADESQEKAGEASGDVAASTLNKTTGTPEDGRAQGQRDISSQTGIEPTVENGTSLPLAPQIPNPLNGEHKKSPDVTLPTTIMSPPAVLDRRTDPEEIEAPHDAGAEGTQLQAGGSKRAVVPPEKRGGRPRSQRSADDSQGEQKKRPRSLCPEIVCWKRGREWVVGVEIPDGISGSGSIVVLQDGAQLAEDGSRPGCWPLATLNTLVKVQVVGSSDNWPIDIPLGDDAWLLFKLSGRGLDHGRKVKQASSGSYLAIVPKTWQRDEEKAGSPPTTPEPAFLEGYLVHFFELTAGVSSCIAFRDGQGKPTIIGSGGPQFHLAGQEIPDASEGIGPLFGGLPPRICIANGQWSNVGTIVVGQEGSGRQRWRESFEPKADQAVQEIPREVLKRKAGWYFLRFYDRADTLIDSLDFRFVAGLKGISIPTAGPAPGPDGHVAQIVEVLHEAGYTVTQKGQECPGLKMEQGTDKTIVTIPATAECDRTRWYIHPANSHGKEVEFTILIERLWWALSSDDKEPSQWEDRPVRLSDEMFRATSDRAIWIRFPKPKWVRGVAAGFRRDSLLRFSVNVTHRAVCIRLREFAGLQQPDDGAAEHKFKVWAEIGQGTHEATVAILPAMTPPVTGRGRFKSAIAEARLQTGSGNIKINGVLVGQYFSHAPHKASIVLQKFCAMPEVKQTLSKFDAVVTVRGSSPNTIRQAKAVAHAIARALWCYDRKLMRPLKQAGFGGASVTQKH